MSDGPIAKERRGHVVPFASTTDAARVCAPGGVPGKGYCGRNASKSKVTSDWAEVVCKDCEAARAADLNAALGSRSTSNLSPDLYTKHAGFT